MTQTQPVPRPNRGCLWGCLAVLAFFLLPALLAAGYGVWFLHSGYSRDPVLRGVMELVRRDGMAEAALGENIHITGIEGSAFSYMWGSGSSGRYDLHLLGSKGEGILHVAAHIARSGLVVDSMILDGPHNQRYDLMHHQALPNDSPTNAI